MSRCRFRSRLAVWSYADLSENFGANLARWPASERGTLIVSLDALLRMSSNRSSHTCRAHRGAPTALPKSTRRRSLPTNAPPADAPKSGKAQRVSPPRRAPQGPNLSLIEAVAQLRPLASVPESDVLAFGERAAGKIVALGALPSD